MTPVVRRTVSARRDLVKLIAYFEQAASKATARRFAQATERAFARLAEMPAIGPRWESPSSRLDDVRTWLVPGFRKYVIFYRPLADGIEVLRVLHGSRDIDALLEAGRSEGPG